MAFLSEPRWSMAAAAITPRESLTASRPFCFPGVIFISGLRRLQEIRYVRGPDSSMAAANEGCWPDVRGLEKDDLVLARAEEVALVSVRQRVSRLVEQFPAVQAEERKRAECAFLQAFVRVRVRRG